jgi:hypothetical protein
MQMHIVKCIYVLVVLHLSNCIWASHDGGGDPIGLVHKELGFPLGLPTDDWASHDGGGESHDGSGDPIGLVPKVQGFPLGLPMGGWVSHDGGGESHQTCP